MQNRNAVVLLIVLVAIVVLTSALAEVARATSRSQISVLRAEKALQQNWGMLSCQRALLPMANEAFLRSDRSARATTRTAANRRAILDAIIRDRVILGGQVFDLILADEDAKANLNTIYDLGGSRACERVLQDTMQLMQSRMIRIQPRRASRDNQTALDAQGSPSRLGDGEGDETSDDELEEEELRSEQYFPPALTTWGDVISLQQLGVSAEGMRELPQITQKVTLWGSGRLNVWRASEDAIIAVCREVVQDGGARRISERLRTTSVTQIDLVLSQTVTNRSKRQELKELLTDSSQCVSLWMEARSGDSVRQELSIQSLDETGLVSTVRFFYP